MRAPKSVTEIGRIPRSAVPTCIPIDVKVPSCPRWTHKLNKGPGAHRVIELPTLCLEKCNRYPLPALAAAGPDRPSLPVTSRSLRLGPFRSGRAARVAGGAGECFMYIV